MPVHVGLLLVAGFLLAGFVAWLVAKRRRGTSRSTGERAPQTASRIRVKRAAPDRAGTIARLLDDTRARVVKSRDSMLFMRLDRQLDDLEAKAKSWASRLAELDGRDPALGDDASKSAEQQSLKSSMTKIVDGLRAIRDRMKAGPPVGDVDAGSVALLATLCAELEADERARHDAAASHEKTSR